MKAFAASRAHSDIQPIRNAASISMSAFFIGALFGALLVALCPTLPLTYWLCIPGREMVNFLLQECRSTEVFPVDLGQYMYFVSGANALFYGVLASLSAYVRHTQLRRSRGCERHCPECAVCGYKWPLPRAAKCPNCHAPNAFAMIAQVEIGAVKCKRCGYDERGTEGQVCPECGTAIE